MVQCLLACVHHWCSRPAPPVIGTMRPLNCKCTQVNEFDQKKAVTALGADVRPLNRSGVEKYLSDFGLDPDIACHQNIRGLSGVLVCVWVLCVFWCVFIFASSCMQLRGVFWLLLERPRSPAALLLEDEVGDL